MLFRRFYIDSTGNPSSVVSEEDQAKVNLRSQRFARGFEGNQTNKPKQSIEQLMKTVVRCCSNCNYIHCMYGMTSLSARTFPLLVIIACLLYSQCVSGDDDWKDASIEGTSQAIEKRYLRLTSVCYYYKHIHTHVKQNIYIDCPLTS